MTIKDIDITIGQIQAALSYNERAIRKLLNSAGAGIDEYATDPEETVPRNVVIDLWSARAAMREGRKLVPLLESTRPSADL